MLDADAVAQNIKRLGSGSSASGLLTDPKPIPKTNPQTLNLDLPTITNLNLIPSVPVLPRPPYRFHPGVYTHALAHRRRRHFEEHECKAQASGLALAKISHIDIHNRRLLLLSNISIQFSAFAFIAIWQSFPWIFDDQIGGISLSGQVASRFPNQSFRPFGKTGIQRFHAAFFQCLRCT